MHPYIDICVFTHKRTYTHKVHKYITLPVYTYMNGYVYIAVYI